MNVRVPYSCTHARKDAFAQLWQSDFRHKGGNDTQRIRPQTSCSQAKVGDKVAKTATEEAVGKKKLQIATEQISGSLLLVAFANVSCGPS